MLDTGRLVQRVRRRVRLRTRLRQARQAWHRRFRAPAWTDLQPRVTRTGDHADIVVATASALRHRVDGASRSVRVVVEDWCPPWPGWSGRLQPLPGLRDERVVLPRGRRGRATVAVTLAEPLPLSRIAAAVHPVFEPLRPPPVDGTARATPAAVTVDATAANPRGRQAYGPRLPVGELRFDGGAWRVVRVPDGKELVAGRAGAPLVDPQREALARLGAVVWTPAGDRGVGPVAGGRDTVPAGGRDTVTDPHAIAGVLAQLAMTGVVLSCPAPPPDAPPGRPDPRDLLAPELASIVTRPLPGGDPMDWEIRSVHQRRAAIRHHAAGLVPPPVTALLVTRRPRLAPLAVRAMAAQTYLDLEIVVGLHGDEEPPGLREAAGDRPLQVVHIPADRNLGEALTAATAAAGGHLLTKVDDDDRYGPEHVWDLVLADHYSGATVVGKGAEFVHLVADDLTVRRTMAAEAYTDVVAGGTLSLRAADLAAVGGWPPVPRHVDRALLDRVLADGGLIYRTHPLGFVYTRHGEGHTWDTDPDYFRHGVQRRWSGLPPYPEFGSHG
ncbi:MAG: glycosyltransferase [Micromonosporaceae bacterium]